MERDAGVCFHGSAWIGRRGGTVLTMADRGEQAVRLELEFHQAQRGEVIFSANPHDSINWLSPREFVQALASASNIDYPDGESLDPIRSPNSPKLY